MQVRNKITGDTTHVKNNDATIQALIKLGILEVVDASPAPGEWVRAQNGAMIPASEPAPVPQWTVSTIQFGVNPEAIPAIVFRVGTHTYEHFTGDPKDAKKGGVAFGLREVPAEVVKQYRQVYDDFYMGLPVNQLANLWEALKARRKERK
jgi:hypothetical protein